MKTFWSTLISFQYVLIVVLPNPAQRHPPTSIPRPHQHPEKPYHLIMQYMIYLKPKVTLQCISIYRYAFLSVGEYNIENCFILN